MFSSSKALHLTSPGMRTVRTRESGLRLLLMMLPVLGLPAFGAQKQITVDPPGPNDPFVVTRITFDGSDVICGLLTDHRGRPGTALIGPVLPFDAGDDWLWHMAIHVFNRTAKPIVHLQLDLAFPEVSNGVGINLGRLPGRVLAVQSARAGKTVAEHPDKPQISLLPGRTLIIRTEDFMTRGGGVDKMFGAMTKGVLYRTDCSFGDGMLWWNGVYSLPDPEHAERYKRLGVEYFPGDRPLQPPSTN